MAALVVVLPLAWLAQPLIAESGSQSASLRFERDLQTFDRVEAELVRRQTDILTFPPNARVNRLEIAKRLRERSARALARRVAAAAGVAPRCRRTIRAPRAGRQPFATTCARAKAPSSCGRWRSRPATSTDRGRAIQAEQQLGETLNVVNALTRE